MEWILVKAMEHDCRASQRLPGILRQVFVLVLLLSLGAKGADFTGPGSSNESAAISNYYTRVLMLKAMREFKARTNSTAGKPRVSAEPPQPVTPATNLQAQYAMAAPPGVPNTFTIIYLPDTQYLSEPTNAAAFATQIDSIVLFAATRNLRAVLHMGDIVDVPTSTEQWTNARCNLDRLRQAGIPHLLGSGNHDVDRPDGPRAMRTWNHYFGPGWFEGRSWWHGGFFCPNAAENAFLLQTNGAYRYVYLMLECFPRTNVLDWANAVLQTYSNHLAFIATHAFVHDNNQRLKTDDPYGQGEYRFSEDGADAEEMWARLRQNKNIVAILSGHQITGQTGRLTTLGDHGNPVTQLLANYQMEEPTNAWYRIMTVRPDDNRIDVETYDPLTSAWRTDEQNRFSFPIFHGEAMAGPGLTSAANTAPIAGDGLLLYLPFDEGSGARSLDRSGHGLVAAASPRRPVFWIPGRAGFAISTANANLFSVPHTNILSGQPQISVACWIQATNFSGSVQTWVSKHGGSLSGEFFLAGLSPNSIRWTTINARANRVNLDCASPPWTDGRWHHICGTYDGAMMRLYFDGALRGAARQSGALNSQDVPLIIGDYFWQPLSLPSFRFSGLLDEVKIWKRSLTANEVWSQAHGNSAR